MLIPIYQGEDSALNNKHSRLILTILIYRLKAPTSSTS